MPNLQLLESSTWTSLKNTTKLCLDKGQTEKNCHNYVKILLTDGDRLFVCGTNSFLPICNWREVRTLVQILNTPLNIILLSLDREYNARYRDYGW